MIDRLKRFFGILPYARPPWRVKLLYDNGFTIREIADVLGTNEQRIARKLRRASRP
jgi:transposase-like protein